MYISAKKQSNFSSIPIPSGCQMYCVYVHFCSGRVLKGLGLGTWPLPRRSSRVRGLEGSGLALRF